MKETSHFKLISFARSFYSLILFARFIHSIPFHSIPFIPFHYIPSIKFIGNSVIIVL